MRTPILINESKLLFLLFIFALLLAPLSSAKAQSSTQNDHRYRGLEVSFGHRQYRLNSSIVELNDLAVGQDGSRIGFVYGNRVLRANLELLGYFCSTSFMKGSIHLYENGASLNFYPFALLFEQDLWIEPYLKGGLTYERMKFRGYYLSDDGGSVNYSTSDAPFLGAVNQVNTYLGAGVDLNILDDYDFVQVFSLVEYGLSSIINTRYSAFTDTSAKNQLLISVGVRFGSKH